MSSVLLDLDGTLTNPQEGITNCINYALQELGHVPLLAADLCQFIGPPLQESFAELLQTCDSVLIQKAIDIYRQRFRTLGLFENYVYEGIELLLGGLVDKGINLYLATSKPEVYAIKILAHFNLAHFFTAVYGSALDGKLSNKSELIRRIIKETELEVASTYMVGDRKHDVIAATANDMRSIGVLWGFGSKQELMESGANHLISSPDHLSNFLLSN